MYFPIPFCKIWSLILFRLGPPSNSSLPGPFIPVRHWLQGLATAQIARLRRTDVAYRWLNTGKVVRCLQRLSNQGPLLYIGAPSCGADGIRVHHLVKLISTTFFVSIHTCLMDNICITFLHFLYL